MTTDVHVDTEFAKELVILAEAFGARLTEARIRIYAEALGDLTIEQVRTARRRAVQECQYFPQAAELLRLVRPTTDDAALLAWTGLQHAASSVGAYAPLVVEDAYAAEAFVRVFGSWPAYCALEDIAVAAKRQEFLAAYRDAKRIEHALHAVRHLSGCLPWQPTGRTWAGRLGLDGRVTHETVVEALRGKVDGRAELEPWPESPDAQGSAQAEGAGRRWLDAGKGRDA